MPSCLTCGKAFPVKGCNNAKCPALQYATFLKGAAADGLVVFGETHKYMADVPFIEGLLACLAAKSKQCVFLMELLPSGTPPDMTYDMPIVGESQTFQCLYPLDENEVDDDRTKFKREWSKTAGAKGVVFQTPFLSEDFTVQRCFYHCCENAPNNEIDESALTGGGDHTRNLAIVRLAKANKVRVFGIDLPGAYHGHMAADRLGSVAHCQRFDTWNILRDAWMSKQIAIKRQQFPNAMICVFVGSDHNEGLSCGGRATEFRFEVDGQIQRRVQPLNNAFNLQMANFSSVLYLKPRSEEPDRSFSLLPKKGAPSEWEY